MGTGRPELVQLCGAVPRAWGGNAGGLAFACNLLEDEDGAPDWSAAARLALTGSPA